MVELPPELVYAILEYVYYRRNGFPDWETLSACSCVSSNWTDTAQKLLFHAVVLDRDRDCSFIACTSPTSENGPRLGAYVRRLDIRVGTSPHEVFSVSDLVTLLTNCPRLYQLTLRISGIYNLDDTTVAHLGALASDPARAPLRALNLYRFSVQSPILYQLLAIFPTVRFLRIGSELAATPPPDPAPFSLTELHLQRLPTPAILRFLLSASLPTLEVLHLHDSPDATLAAVLAPHGPRLRALRLFQYNAGGAAFIRRCPALAELVIVQLSTVLPLAALPPTIEHFSFRDFVWDSNTSLQTVIAAVDTLPRLHVVTCDANAQKHVDYPALRQKCAQRGIELRADALPLMAMDDPVPVRVFPRRKSVSNLRLMN